MEKIVKEVEAFVIEEMRKIKPEMPDNFSTSASFKMDLGLDSLDLVEWVARLEQHYLVEIPDGDWEQLSSIDETVKYITTHVPLKQ